MAHLFIVVKAHIKKAPLRSGEVWKAYLQFCWIVSFHGGLLDGEMRFLLLAVSQSRKAAGMLILDDLKPFL